MKNINLAFGMIAGLAVLQGAERAQAGNDLYFVTYNHHIEKGEVEVMFMNDFTAPSKFKREDDGQRSYFSQVIEVEYGVTEQYATEFMLEGFEEATSGQSRFTGFRWENRYRLFEKEIPLNPMLYMEYEDLDPLTRFKMETSGWIRPLYTETGIEPDRERILESRLVLSQDFGPVNAAFNWINETDLTAGGFTAFGYSAGLRYSFNGGHHGERERGEVSHAGHEHHAVSGKKAHHRRLSAVGLELYGGLGRHPPVRLGADAPGTLSGADHDVPSPRPGHVSHRPGHWVEQSQRQLGAHRVGV